MSKTPLEAKGKAEEPERLELRADGEERFRAAVHAAAKSGPKHRESNAKARERGT